jgi:hypothetical protein
MLSTRKSLEFTSTLISTGLSNIVAKYSAEADLNDH